MKRSPLKRSTTMTARVPVQRKCKVCRELFAKRSMTHVACSPACAEVVGQAKAAKERAAAERVDRRETREKLERLKSISHLEADCRKIIQKIARIRDRADGCISCHMGSSYDGQWHGSHYRAHGACSSLQFNLWNVHKACAQCNLFKGGNREGFVRGLLLKPGYGPERLAWLDNQPKSQRFERDYLLRFKVVMSKRMRRMGKAYG